MGVGLIKMPSSHAEEMAERLRAEVEMAEAKLKLEAEAAERARKREELVQREHEAWKRQLLRERNLAQRVWPNAHPSPAPDNTFRDAMLTTAAVTYVVGSGGGSGRSEDTSCDTSGSSDSSGGGND